MKHTLAATLLLLSLPCAGEIVYLGDTKDFVCKPPATRTDGTPLNEGDIAEYRWYETLGTTAAVRLESTTACGFSYTFSTLGTVTINVTAYATVGGESVFSEDKVFEVVPQPDPDKPSKLRVITAAVP